MDLSICMLDISPEESINNSIKSFAKIKKKKKIHIFCLALVY